VVARPARRSVTPDRRTRRRPLPDHGRATCPAITLLMRLIPLIGLVNLGACSPASEFYGKDISATMPPLEFTLQGAAGKTVTASAVRGKVTLLYFGYTSSPDVCPTTLLKLALALERLGDDAGSVRILFVSVDPKRDSPAVLRSYVDTYAPEAMGLTGSEDELNALTRRYHVAFRPEVADSGGAYPVYISSNDVFAFGRGGRARILITPSETEDQISEDLKTLIG
jgi:protein SCO1